MNPATDTRSRGLRFAWISLLLCAVLPLIAAPGLKQTIRRDQQSDTCVARLAAMYLPEGSAPTPFLSPGPFESILEGELNLKLNDYFLFSAEGAGRLSVEIRGKTILDITGPDLAGTLSQEVDLKKGPNPVRITYRSPADGDAWFRLYWENPTRPREPLPPIVLTHDPDRDPALASMTQRRHGRRLFAEGRCAGCHRPEAPFSLATAMPELAMDAPALTGIGRRLNAAWIAEWLVDPRQERDNARMPRVLHGAPEVVRRDARDIAAFLAPDSTGPGTKPDVSSPEQLVQGEERFATLGCVTCHRLPGEPPLKPENRLSLAHVPGKWRAAALVEFLMNPGAHYRWIRMPDFHLNRNEAEALAAFIRSRAQPVHPAPVQGDPVRGKKLVSSTGCIACHTLDGMQSGLTSPSLGQLTSVTSASGCLSGQPGPGGHPVYTFADPERAALLGFLKHGTDSLRRRSWREFAERQIESLQCIACHERDGKADLWSLLLVQGATGGAVGGDDDLIDEFDDFEDDPVEGEAAPGESNIHLARPPLTWAGEKLHADWMTAFIAGTLPYKPRAQLKARMPGFPAYAEGIALGMVFQHGFSAVRPPSGPIDQAMVPVGRTLIEVDKMGCASCHAVGQQGALSGKEAEAINFQYAPLRLRRHYYDRFVMDPQRLLPGTMMPKFVDEAGRSPLTDYYEGDAKKQFEAIWNFMRTLGN